MWIDKDKEFYDKDVQALIELYSTQNEEKSAVVKRWIKIETLFTWPHLVAWWLCKEAIMGQGDLKPWALPEGLGFKSKRAHLLLVYQSCIQNLARLVAIVGREKW